MAGGGAGGHLKTGKHTNANTMTVTDEMISPSILNFLQGAEDLALAA